MACKRKAASLANGANGDPMISAHNKGINSNWKSQIREERRGPLEEVANRLLIADLLRDEPEVKRGPFKYIYFAPEEGSILLRGKGRACDYYVTVPSESLSEVLQIAVRRDIKKIKVVARRGCDYFAGTRVPAYCKERGIRLCLV